MNDGSCTPHLDQHVVFSALAILVVLQHCCIATHFPLFVHMYLYVSMYVCPHVAARD